MDSCPPQGEAGDDIDDSGPDFIRPINQVTTKHGCIRGSKRTPLKFDRPWVNFKQLLDWVERKRLKMCLGARGLLHIAQTDGKQRFQFRGRYNRPRCEYIGQAYYALWVSAGHGHHQSLAERLAGSSIATEWLRHYKRQELTGKYATFEGRPVVGIDKAPPRLYHRTLRDAAFSILENGMIAGDGGSGKLHNYLLLR